MGGGTCRPEAKAAENLRCMLHGRSNGSRGEGRGEDGVRGNKKGDGASGSRASYLREGKLMNGGKRKRSISWMTSRAQGPDEKLGPILLPSSPSPLPSSDSRETEDFGYDTSTFLLPSDNHAMTSGHILTHSSWKLPVAQIRVLSREIMTPRLDASSVTNCELSGMAFSPRMGRHQRRQRRKEDS